MPYQVFMSFDLHQASEEDYAKFYHALAKFGLDHWANAQDEKIELPQSTVIGNFNGNGAASVRDYIRASVVEIMGQNQLKGYIFVTVGNEATWGTNTVD